MKQKLGIFALFFLFSSVCLAQEKEEKAVYKTFDTYKDAILNDKGKEAVEEVDSRTMAYYTGILEDVKEADSLEVDSMDILDKLMVLSIRHRATREQILSFDGKTLLVYAIESGMVGKNSVQTLSIANVEVEDDFAKGQIVANGQEAPFHFHFYKEEGRWKIDLTSIFSISKMAFKQLMENNEQPENEYLLMLLEMVSGEEVKPTIWEPVKE